MMQPGPLPRCAVAARTSLSWHPEPGSRPPETCSGRGGPVAERPPKGAPVQCARAGGGAALAMLTPPPALRRAARLLMTMLLLASVLLVAGLVVQGAVFRGRQYVAVREPG